MFTQIFDTHSHYTDSAFDEDRDQVLDALPKEGIVHAVLAGTTLEDSAAGIALTRRYDYLYAAVGIHPETAGQQPADYLAQLERMAADPRVVAVGEIGLDYHYEGYDRDVQIRLFREQLDLAKQLDLPVIIHGPGLHRGLCEHLTGDASPWRGTLLFRQCRDRQRGTETGNVHRFHRRADL